ncbi:Spy/CpxP family protein refolding chaperone [Mangrovitalea sediminis]|uniref:Spy/CpxP family protein refolding chaperone n=1 Tax=Mangrovitalea sediminis TaxID=1982043 RepID=UPI001178B25A|nr:periplasmic heavy metal sensor [Mangrovitalea sediminis]
MLIYDGKLHWHGLGVCMKGQRKGWGRLGIGLLLVVLGLTLASITSAHMAGYGPGTMMASGNGTASGNTTSGAICGPGMTRGFGYCLGSGMGPGMMGGYGMGPGMMGGYGYGMGPGMMGGYGMGPGMMGGYGYGMGPGMMGGYGMGPGMMGGYGYGMGPGMMGGWAGSPLQLTRQQEEQIGKVIEGSVARQLKHAEQLHLHMFDLNQALSKPDPDMAAVKKAYDAVEAQRRAMFLERIEMGVQLRKLLTKEQLETLQKHQRWMWDREQDNH